MPFPCSHCQAATINGVRCHETGCPDAWRDYAKPCRECGCDFAPESRWQSVCDDCSHPVMNDIRPLSDFIRDQSVTMTSERIAIRPDVADPGTERDDAWQRDASHWRSTLRRSGDQRRSLTVYYSMGSAHTGEPTAADVLSSLLLDASGPEEFADWCGDFGYDTDSRRAERTFKACQVIARKLRRFLGDQYDAAQSTEH